jgi:hypothetical protein
MVKLAIGLERFMVTKVQFGQQKLIQCQGHWPQLDQEIFLQSSGI